MPKLAAVPRRSRAQQILIIGREHWDHDCYDPNARRVFRRALQCKTPALGRRVYASENEEREFCNTCKSLVACTSCGHWATTQWQRQREYALPDGRYLSITFTMPKTLWPLFGANPRLCRKLPEIAARVIGRYARVRKGAEVGVTPVLQTFNGKLEFNPHVHTLVTAGDLLTAGPQAPSSIFFDPYELRGSWKRLVIVLLRGALEAGQLKSGMPRDEVERLLQEEEKRTWYSTHVHADAPTGDGPVHSQGIHRPVGTAHPTTLSPCGEILRIVCSAPLGPGSHRSFHHPWHEAATTTQAPSVGGCHPRAGRPNPLVDYK